MLDSVGQVMVRYYGRFAQSHRGKVKKASLVPLALRMVEEELRRIPSKAWATMIRKVYEVDPATGTSRRGSEADRWRHLHPGAPATFGRH